MHTDQLKSTTHSSSTMRVNTNVTKPSWSIWPGQNYKMTKLRQRHCLASSRLKYILVFTLRDHVELYILLPTTVINYELHLHCCSIPTKWRVERVVANLQHWGPTWGLLLTGCQTAIDRPLIGSLQIDIRNISWSLFLRFSSLCLPTICELHRKRHH